jgi:hypothetical protein
MGADAKAGDDSKSQSGGEAPMGALGILGVLVALLLPVGIVFAGMSEIGFGVDLFNFVYEFKENLSIVQQCDTLLAPGLGILFICFLLDANGVVWLIGAYIMQVALFFSVGKGPFGSFGEGPLLVTAMQIPVLLVAVNKTICRGCSNEDFFRWVMYCALLVTVGTAVAFSGWIASGDNFWFAARKRLPDQIKPVQHSRAADYGLEDSIWSDYDFNTHCPMDIQRLKTLELPGKEPRVVDADLRNWCKKVSGIAFYIWGSPMCIGLCMLVVAMISGLLRVLDPKTEDEGKAQSKDAKQKQVELTVRLLMMLTAGFLIFLYLASYLAGAATTALATVQLFIGVAFVISGFALLKTLPPDVTRSFSDSKIVKNLVGLLEMSFVRALISFLLFAMLPLVFPAGWLKQRIREARDPTVPKSTFSPVAQRISDFIRSWHVGSVMTWHVIIAAVVFGMDIIAKGTYVVLSMLGDYIADFHVALVSFILSCAGFLVFMNPAMPGPVVYVLVGLVVTGRICRGAKADAGLADEDQCPVEAFVSSLLLCTTLCFLTKLAAVCGQMEIGRRLGMKVSIQKMIGVEKPGIRAIELILKKPGLFPGKVAILCGGPDWPTSVLCGILKQSKAAMCFGTSPMFFICFPSVLGGAIINMEGGGGFWSQMSDIAKLGLIISQCTVGLTGVYYISGYTSSSDPEVLKILHDPRPEHAAVEKLSREMAAFEASYHHHTKWKTMTGVQKGLLALAWLGTLGTAIAVSTNGRLFFKKFAASSRVDAPYDNEPPGLDGKPLSLVESPAGYIVMAIHYFAFAVFQIWKSSVTKDAKNNVLPMSSDADDTNDKAAVNGSEDKKLLDAPPEVAVQLLGAASST